VCLTRQTCNAICTSTHTSRRRVRTAKPGVRGAQREQGGGNRGESEKKWITENQAKQERTQEQKQRHKEQMHKQEEC